MAEACYTTLRRLRSLSARCPDDHPRKLLLAAMYCLRGWNLKQLAPILRDGDAEWLAVAKAAKTDEWPPAVRCDFPDWLFERLAPRFPGEIEALAAALNRPAPLDLRVNLMKTTREAVLRQLAGDHIAAEACRYSPLGIRLEENWPLEAPAVRRDGSIEVQDEGSQLLGYLVAPKRGEMVADFCAGAGNKTLLLGALMRSTGRLYAFDVAEKRLANLKPRLARSGLSNASGAHRVRERPEGEAAGRQARPGAGRCAVFRTWYAAPQSRSQVAPVAGERRGAGGQADRHPGLGLATGEAGGRLVYATCSLLTEENDAVVEAFLAAHPDFRALPAGELLQRQDIELPLTGDALRLLPHLHGSDGFFAMAMERA